jgi:hypothetical protein
MFLDKPLKWKKPQNTSFFNIPNNPISSFPSIPFNPRTKKNHPATAANPPTTPQQTIPQSLLIESRFVFYRFNQQKHCASKTPLKSNQSLSKAHEMFSTLIVLMKSMKLSSFPVLLK